jgi:hypothetical protein
MEAATNIPFTMLVQVVFTLPRLLPYCRWRSEPHHQSTDKKCYINENANTVRSTSSAAVNLSGTVPYITDSKSLIKKVIKIKGPGASTYTNITAKNRTNSELLFQEQLTAEFL